MVKRTNQIVSLSENDLALIRSGEEITRNGVKITFCKPSCVGPTITPSKEAGDGSSADLAVDDDDSDG